MSLPASPFKGLSYFGDSDHDRRFFFGRDRESEVVAANLMASRLTVLYGPSGVGKSSLLRAGVTSRLRSLVPAGGGDGGVAVAVVDSWRDDPVAAVRAAAGARDDVSLADALAERAIATGEELYLVLDQMEEYVLYHGRDGGPLGDELEEVLTRPDLPVHVLLGVRDDALAELDAFKRRLPGLFGNVLRLDHLTRAAARSAIEEPLLAYAALGGAAVRADDDFVEAVLGEVTAGRIEQRLTGRGLVPAGGRTRRVEAPYLQLVLERVWDVERQHGSDRLRLATFKELGGAERIVEAHLERALAGLAASDLDTVARLFDHLVTPSGSKIAHSRDDLVRYGGADAAALDTVLGTLAAERIVRPVPARNGGGPRYEIFHDVLAGAVLAWRVRHDTARALAAEREAARRRQRRLALLALGALVALAVLAALTLYAFDLRAEAKEQTAIAEEQTQLALAAQANAEANAAVAEAKAAEADENAAEAEANAAEAETQRQAATAATKQAKQAQTTAVEQRDAASAAATRARAAESATAQQRDAAQQARDEATTQAAIAVTQKRRADEERAAATAARATAVRERDSAREARGAAERSAEVARRAETRAEEAARVATAGQLVAEAVSLLDIDPEQGVLLALRAEKLARPAGLEAALRDLLAALRVRSVLPGGGGAVRTVAVSPDGRLVVVPAESGEARLYELATGRRLARIRHGEGRLNVAVFSPDGASVVTGGEDGVARRWDARTGAPLAQYAHFAGIRGIAFSPDGNLVATAAGEAVRVWNAASGTRVIALPQPFAAEAVSFNAAGTMLLALSRDVRLYQVEGWRLTHTLDQPGLIVTAKFAPVGPLVATGGRDDLAMIWDSRSGAPVHQLTGHLGDVIEVAWSPRADFVGTASADNGGRVYRVDTGGLLTFLGGHTNQLTGIAFSPDGASVATTSFDRSADVWMGGNYARGAELLGHGGDVYDVVFAPDGGSVVTTSDDGSARIWKPAVDPILANVGNHAAAGRAVATSQRGDLIASVGLDNTLRLWRRNGRVVRTIPHPTPLVDVALTADGALVATAGQDGIARVWRVADGALQGSFAHGAPIRTVALDRDGGRVVTGGADGIARLWRRLGGAARELRHGNGAVAAVAFSPDGRRVATAGEDSEGRVWRVSDARLLGKLKGHHADDLTGIAYSPDGKTLVTSSVDAEARLWNANTFAHERVLSGHSSLVGDVTFSADGRWIATAGPTTVGLWEARTRRRIEKGAPVFFLRGHGPRVRGVAFAPDSRRVFSIGDDGTVRTYLCELCGTAGELVRLADRRLDRLEAGLTPAERTKYLGRR